MTTLIVSQCVLVTANTKTRTSIAMLLVSKLVYYLYGAAYW